MQNRKGTASSRCSTCECNVCPCTSRMDLQLVSTRWEHGAEDSTAQRDVISLLALDVFSSSLVKLKVFGISSASISQSTFMVLDGDSIVVYDCYGDCAITNNILIAAQDSSNRTINPWDALRALIMCTSVSIVTKRYLAICANTRPKFPSHCRLEVPSGPPWIIVGEDPFEFRNSRVFISSFAAVLGGTKATPFTAVYANWNG